MSLPRDTHWSRPRFTAGRVGACWRRYGTVIAGALALAACGDATRLPTEILPVEPEPWVQVSLVTPNTNDGAVLLSITGGAVLAVEGVGVDLDARLQEGGGATLLLRGDLETGPVARIRIPSGVAAGSYTGRVLQAAQRESLHQQALSGYRLELVAISGGAAAD